MRIAWAKANCAYAETMGSAFPSHSFNGIVHSVFPHALNLLDASDGTLYTLVTARESLYPRGMVVRQASQEGLDFCALGLQEGQTLTADYTGIIFDCGLWVSFLGAKRTHARHESPPERIRLDFDLIQAGCAYLSYLQDVAQTNLRLSSLFSQNSSDSLFIKKFHTSAHLLRASFSKRSLEDAVAAGKTLVGFGPGLTPAGDDFLCGFALAAYSRSTVEKESSMNISKQFVHNWLEKLLETTCSPVLSTNIISLNFLSLAAAEKFSYGLLNLATAFEIDKTNRIQHIKTALDLLSHHGHSSGLDAGTGFLFGLLQEIPFTA